LDNVSFDFVDLFADYDEFKGYGAALHGLVQSLMLTSHLLFVGFSLRDFDFRELASQVRTVRRSREEADSGPLAHAGTALALQSDSIDSDAWSEEIRTVVMTGDSEVKRAARTLEIFLDRLAWSAMQGGELAAEYLLDPSYREGASGEDLALSAALEKFLNELPDDARQSAGWPRVAQTLTALGRPTAM
jgi:hypothetical protein